MKYQTTGLVPSDNEATVIKVFHGDHIQTVLCHKFITEAGDPFLRFIEFFESRKVRIHLLYPKLLLLMSQQLSFFIKTNGLDLLSPSQLLQIDPEDPELQVEKKDLFVGSKVATFVKKMNLNHNSPELAGFYTGVRKYYHKSTAALLKYAKTPLSNPFLSALMVLDPSSRDKETLGQQRRLWDILATQLDHIISEEQKTVLLTTELVSYQALEQAEAGIEVDEWWALVLEVELGGLLQFPQMGNLALACLTIFNSGSEAERDFSFMENIYADNRSNNTGQELLDSKMIVNSAVKAEAEHCARCIESKKDKAEKERRGENVPKREQTSHCRCSLVEVDSELLAKLRNYEPHKKEDVE